MRPNTHNDRALDYSVGVGMSLFQLIRSDYRRYRAAGAGPLAVVLLTQGFWASFVYRWQHHVATRIRVPILRRLLGALGVPVQKAIEILTGIYLPARLSVGAGLYIGHFGGIILSPEARLGRNCNLSQGVTLGVSGRGDRRGAPRLGDRVYVGAGAILLGSIEIGDDAAIGAGAVVTKSVPARAVVAGNPARVLSQHGSFEFVHYTGMEIDPERQASLRARDTVAGAALHKSAHTRADPADPISTRASTLSP